MAFPGKFVDGVNNGSTAAEMSLQMLETVQERLKQRRCQLEDIVARQKSLAQEYERLDATAADVAQQFSGIMRDLEPDSSAPVDLGDAGLNKDHKTKRWKTAAMLTGTVIKARDEQIA